MTFYVFLSCYALFLEHCVRHDVKVKQLTVTKTTTKKTDKQDKSAKQSSGVGEIGSVGGEKSVVERICGTGKFSLIALFGSLRLFCGTNTQLNFVNPVK